MVILDATKLSFEHRGVLADHSTLRFALQVALLLVDHDAPQVAQAWFQGLNPHLEDRSPAWLVREGDLHEVGPLVLAAARAFAVDG